MRAVSCQPPSGGCVLKHYYKSRGRGRSNTAAFRRLCVETSARNAQRSKSRPAAFRRLCVETAWLCSRHLFPTQPPSGGCVLKQQAEAEIQAITNQPPSGGCVLKPYTSLATPVDVQQPPSGGCVLKRRANSSIAHLKSAAFRRLCVETSIVPAMLSPRAAAAFRRLCVETILLRL